MYLDQLQTIWNDYWPLIYDFLSQPPPLLWIILGVAIIVLLLPIRRNKMNREDHVRRVVSDEALKMLENLAEAGRITWAEAEREMIRMGRNFHWGDLLPGRTNNYTLTKRDQEYLKGTIRSRRAKRRANGDRPVRIPGDNPPADNKKMSSGKIGQLIARHTL